MLILRLRKNLFTLGLVIILGITAACSQKDNYVSGNVVKIKISEAENLLTSVKELSMLKLTDSIGNHFPGDMSKVVFYGDSMFVLDTWKDPGVYIYDSEGILVDAYARRGNGPEEYEGIYDMWIGPTTISLLVNFPDSKIITLDRHLNFIDREDVESGAQHFAIGKNGIFFDRGNNAYNGNDGKLIYVSTLGKKEIKLLISPDIENLTFTSLNVFSKMGEDTIIYLPSLEPRLYFCTGNDVRMACEFDFGNTWPYFSVRTDRVNLMDVMQDIVRTGKIYSTNLVGDEKNIAVTFFVEEDYYIILLDAADLSSPRILRVPDENHDAIGDLVAIKDSRLVFAVPGKLTIATLKSTDN